MTQDHQELHLCARWPGKHLWFAHSSRDVGLVLKGEVQFKHGEPGYQTMKMHCNHKFFADQVLSIDIFLHFVVPGLDHEIPRVRAALAERRSCLVYANFQSGVA